MTSGRALSRLFLVHAAITAAAGIVLLAAPGLIPGAVGIRLDPSAFLLCYLLAAAEFGFASLSYCGARVTNPAAVRVLVLACVVLHIASALFEMLAIARGGSAILWGNVAARVVVAGLFLHLMPPRQKYDRVPLTRSGVDHFHAAGRLAGRAVAVLVDTGAASTVVSLALARQLGLTLQELSTRGAGAGGAQLPIFHVSGATLELDGATPRPRALLAMDLVHVNQALTLKGEAPVDVILGADVLAAQAAIIDYGSGSLFLRPPAG